MFVVLYSLLLSMRKRDIFKWPQWQSEHWISMMDAGYTIKSVSYVSPAQVASQKLGRLARLNPPPVQIVESLQKSRLFRTAPTAGFHLRPALPIFSGKT